MLVFLTQPKPSRLCKKLLRSKDSLCIATHHVDVALVFLLVLMFCDTAQAKSITQEASLDRAKQRADFALVFLAGVDVF